MEKNDSSESKNRRDVLLEKYDQFLTFVEWLLDEELPDHTKMKNKSNYTLVLNGNGYTKFAESFFKKFEVIKVAQKWFMKDAVKEHKSKIKAAEYYLLPLYEKDFDLNSIFIVKKKNKIDKIKQRVKSLLDDLLPKPQPNYN